MTDRQAVDTTAEARDEAIQLVANEVHSDCEWQAYRAVDALIAAGWVPPAEVAAREAAADRLVKGLRKAVKGDDTEWVDANVVRLLLDRHARGAVPIPPPNPLLGVTVDDAPARPL